jgi:hypothetical protein
MHRFVLTSLLVCSGASATSAQQGTSPDVEAQTVPPGQVIMTAPSQTSASGVYFDYDLKEAEERSRRTRNALIATSAVTGVGIILLGVGSSQCEEGFNDSDDRVCNNAGDVLRPLGGSLFGAGSIGMITSGIMLGVSNKRKREIQRDMRRHYHGSRFHWDVGSGRFAF